MIEWHCLECGTKLKQTTCNEGTDKYFCAKCNKNWFRVRKVIIEWVKENA